MISTSILSLGSHVTHLSPTFVPTKIAGKSAINIKIMYVNVCNKKHIVVMLTKRIMPTFYSGDWAELMSLLGSVSYSKSIQT